MAATLVTGVDKKYLPKLKKNLPEWRKMDIIKYLPLVIFVHEDCWHDEYWESHKKQWDGDIRLVKWTYPIAKSHKEEMFSAFIFGVAKEITTRYWIKLDADATPKGEHLNIPAEAWESTVTGHSWNYTKVKHDTQYALDGIHWLNRLDLWANNIKDFKGTKALFLGKKISGAKHNHKRIAGFFQVEKRKFTQHLAKILEENGGRMPIPSHDTLVWYVVTRLANGRTVLRYNFRRYFTA